VGQGSRSSSKPWTFQQFCDLIGLELEPFQRKIASAIAGPQRETVVLICRGNGKTTLLAAVSLWHLLTVENAAVYCAAAGRKQAAILYEAAAEFARKLDLANIVDRHLELRWCPDPAKPRVFERHLRVLAADARQLHGLMRPSLVIVDEMHAHPDDEVYVTLRSAMLKVPGSKLVCISSAGQGADTPLGRLRTRAFAQPSVVRKGAFTDAKGPNLRLLEWSLPEDADITDPKTVAKANPASWITPALLAETAEAIPELSFRRFHAGQWTERAGHWLPAGAWQACVGAPEFTDGERIWVGLDVGGEVASTALTWINENLNINVWIGHGDAAILEAKERIEELATRYDLCEFIFDPWRAGQLAQELQERGINVREFAQSDSRMCPASARLYDAIVHKRIVLPDDEEMRQQSANTVARHSRRGWRIDAPARDVNVDSIVALAMAVEHAESGAGGVEYLGTFEEVFG
jgi:phage terminase large subunit-like protein